MYITCYMWAVPEFVHNVLQVGGFLDLSTPRVRQQGGNLTITSTVKEDHGKYECVASTTIATIVSPTELKILSEALLSVVLVVVFVVIVVIIIIIIIIFATVVSPTSSRF